MLQFGFGRVVTKIPRRFIDRCRNVDLAAVSNAQFFYPCLKSCALHPESSGGTCGAADDRVRILGKWKSKNPEFQKI